MQAENMSVAIEPLSLSLHLYTMRTNVFFFFWAQDFCTCVLKNLCLHRATAATAHSSSLRTKFTNYRGTAIDFLTPPTDGVTMPSSSKWKDQNKS